MSDLISIVFPVFGLIFVGYAAGQFNLLGERTGEGLSNFVFTLAIPSLIFRTMANAALPDAQPWSYWLAYFTALACVWAVSMAIAQRLFRQSYGESVVAGFSAAQANTVLVGIPMILRAYGDEGAVPLFLLIAIHLPITMTAATLMIEGSGGFDIRVLGKRLLLHPILLGLFCGVAFRMTGLKLSGPPAVMLDMIAGAATPCALIAMGLALKRVGFAANGPLTAIVVVLKLAVHPFLVWILAFRLLPVPPVWAGVAVLFAAMPSGVNAYLFAERYRTGVALSSSAIAATTGLSVFTTMFWLWFLGVSR